MVSGAQTKAASLVLTLIVTAIALWSPDLTGMGLFPECSLWQRLSYPFLHASLLHCAVNCWVLLSVVFARKIPFWQLFVAYIIAITYPVSIFASLAEYDAVVGLSGVVFALIGIITPSTAKLVAGVLYVVTLVLISAFMPNVAWTLHLYCYLVGLIVGMITTPMSWQRS
ncbi:MAG: rhomboid family intramembrane serine protease [Bacteroidaceae bacterium]|nr:rhomboid family intramembrane serine protease [Bacteroidaceae bacterium]